MPIAPTPHTPPPRNRLLELVVEQAAAAVARARQRHGDDAVRQRVEQAVSPEDAETTARVLRVLARELGDEPVDLSALDARLRSLGAPAAAASAPEAAAGSETASASASETASASASASRTASASASRTASASASRTASASASASEAASASRAEHAADAPSSDPSADDSNARPGRPKGGLRSSMHPRRR